MGRRDEEALAAAATLDDESRTAVVREQVPIAHRHEGNADARERIE
jgi:hypothetical protein